jgi:hypothetical protein
LDDSLGEETTLSFSYQRSGKPTFAVDAFSPRGTVYPSTNSDITSVDEKARVMKMKIPGTAEVSFSITKEHFSDEVVNFYHHIINISPIL